MKDQIASIAIMDPETMEFARQNRKVSERTARRAAEAHRQEKKSEAQLARLCRIARSVLVLTAMLAINVWDLINPVLGLAAVIAAAVHVGMEVNRK